MALMLSCEGGLLYSANSGYNAAFRRQEVVVAWQNVKEKTQELLQRAVRTGLFAARRGFIQRSNVVE